MNADNNNVLEMPQVLQRPVLMPLARFSEEARNEIVTRLKEAAAADKHACVAPTHLMMKGENIVGYLSMGGMPNVHAWFDTKNPHALDSVKMIEMGELVLREHGAPIYSLLCAEESPFTPHLERLGFMKLGHTVLYVKQL